MRARHQISDDRQLEAHRKRFITGGKHLRTGVRSAGFRPIALMAALVLAAAALTSDASAQRLDEETLATRLNAAVVENDAGHLVSLIEQNRLKVKPVVNDLIAASIAANLAGDATRAAEKRAAAEAIASTFESRFGEKSLSEAVSYIGRWSRDEQRDKLLADSLLAHGRELRSGDDALQAYSTALETYRRIGDRIGEAEALGGFGVVYWYAGSGDSTLAFFERALASREEVDDRRLVGNSLNDIGQATTIFLRDYQAAAEYFLDAINVRTEIGDSIGLAKSLLFLADSYRQVGAFSDAVPFYQQAAEAAGAVGDSDRQAKSLFFLGLVLSDLGRHSDALLQLERAHDIRRARNDVTEIAAVLNMIGEVYRRIGDYDAALERYLEATRLAEELGDVSALAYALLNTGILLNYAERYEQAVPRFEKARPLFKHAGEARGEIWAVTGLSNAYVKLKEYAKAVEYGTEALRLSREAKNETEETRAFITLANAELRAGAHDTALSHYQEALERTRQLDDPDLGWMVRMGLGEYHESLGEYEEAIRFYAQALDVVETVRGGLQTAQDRSGFFAERRFAYENIIHLFGLLHEANPEGGYELRGFEFAERAKARSFLDLLSEGTSISPPTLDARIEQRQEALLSDIGQTRRALQVETTRQSPDRSEVARLDEKLDRLEEEYQNLQRGKSLAAGDSPDGVIRVLGPKEVQAELLDENDVLLQYAVGDSSSSLWIVTRDAVKMVRLPDGTALEEQVEVLRYALSAPEVTAADTYSQSAHSLYELLIGPAAQYVESGYHLIVIPDGVLHYLPFEALLVQARTTGSSFTELDYLVRRVPISYAPSASVLMQLKNDESERERSFDKQLIAFGDPDFGDLDGQGAADASSAYPAVRFGLERLPHSGTEVRTIAALFAPDEGDVYLRAEAAEEQIKADGALQDYRFVHFATHGIVDEQRPDFSGLVLAQTQGAREDGFLQAAEIFDMTINAELAVLSACETGLGKMVRGEGLVGLTQAFMYAGVPSLVVSLWRVADESTSRLMERFYSAMVEREMDVSDALRHAKLEMIRHEAYAHPFHWAPFIRIGKTE